MRRPISVSIPAVLLLAVCGCIMAGLLQGCSPTQKEESGSSAAPNKTQAGPVTCADSESSTSQFPPTPTIIDKTCAVIPLDMSGTPEQGPADLYSWLTFVAVNWPVDAKTCTADPSSTILSGTPNPTWLTFLSNDEVFVPKPNTPANWCYQKPPTANSPAAFASVEDAAAARHSAKLAQLPPKVRQLAQKYPDVQLFLHYSGKSDGLLMSLKKANSAVPPELQQILDATHQPVTDQNGRFVRYTVNIGKDEYGYIMAQKLWQAAGQKATGDLSFPASREPSGTELGAMEFKAAWKVLRPGDDPTHFFTQKAIVYNDQGGDPSPEPQPVTVGLVGLHITHKTQRQHRWLWSTFEQVENDTKSFFNPNCPASQCPPNVQTATVPYFELNADGTPHNKPVQVVPAVETTAASLNSAFQALLPNTPWAYYKLISTQWVGNLGTAPKPAKLGNSVLETFVNEVKPYSCMDCHNFAHNSEHFKSDFSFIIRARQ